jgi:aryl-alcohol dehydrogenase-like predicted oxidoreductase
MFLASGLALPAAGLAHPEQAAPPPAKDVKFTYRTLGKTGLKVTSLSFGCMTTSDASVIEHAADMGVIHFDTARSYQNGNNERLVGAALKGRRQKVVLSSKSGAPTRAEVLADLDTSLRELGTDHLDIWYLHMKNNPSEVTEDLLEAQRIAKKAGKIRSLY